MNSVNKIGVPMKYSNVMAIWDSRLETPSGDHIYHLSIGPASPSILFRNLMERAIKLVRGSTITFFRVRGKHGPVDAQRVILGGGER
jgi:hypothetical protein